MRIRKSHESIKMFTVGGGSVSRIFREHPHYDKKTSSVWHRWNGGFCEVARTSYRECLWGGFGRRVRYGSCELRGFYVSLWRYGAEDSAGSFEECPRYRRRCDFQCCACGCHLCGIEGRPCSASPDCGEASLHG